MASAWRGREGVSPKDGREAAWTWYCLEERGGISQANLETADYDIAFSCISMLAKLNSMVIEERCSDIFPKTLDAISQKDLEVKFCPGAA